MKNLKAISLSIVISGLLATTASALVSYPQRWYSGTCINISRDLSYHSRGSDVSQLQAFLVSKNFPGSGSWMQTGFFGAATQVAVRDFQQQENLSTSGIVDYQTREALSRITCDGLLAYGAPATPPYPTTIPWNGYGNGYPYNNGGLVSLNLTALSQNTGNVGAPITLYGTGFDPIGNTVNFGTTALSGIPSSGTSMTFVVPSSSAYGTVNISVRNSRGTSNALTFTVNSYGYGCGNNYFYPSNLYSNTAAGSCGCNTGYNNYNYGTTYSFNQNNTNYGNCGTTNPPGNTDAPTINYLNPISGAVGTSITVIGSGFSTTNNTVHFGNGIIANLTSSDGRSVSFVVPAVLSGYGTQNVGLGIYNVSVTNNAGHTTNLVPFTVTSLVAGGAITISSLSPNAARVGTSVTLYGSGFLGNNTIMFGSGALQNTYSSNDSIITFVVPSYVTPYCAGNYACPQYAQQITPGTYNISLMGQRGTSNTVVLTVF